MPRPAALVALLCLCPLPAIAADGLFVWSDPAAMAVKLARFDAADPAQITGLRVLMPLQSISVTQTAVATGGTAIGICHELQDGNEGDWELLGFDAKGNPTWTLQINDLGDGLAPFLGADARPGTGHLFFYSCDNGGATGVAGVLAFDLGIYRTETGDMRIARINVDGRTGRIIAADLRPPAAKSALPLVRNPFDHWSRVDGGARIMSTEGVFTFPAGGTGPVLWGTHPMRWQGVAAVTGHDFAWWLPPPP